LNQIESKRDPALPTGALENGANLISEQLKYLAAGGTV